MKYEIWNMKYSEIWTINISQQSEKDIQILTPSVNCSLSHDGWLQHWDGWGGGAGTHPGERWDGGGGGGGAGAQPGEQAFGKVPAWS